MAPAHRMVLQRRRLLLAIAALLIIGGALLTLNAPGSSPVSNKADAYGPAVTTPKPTNPKSKTECVKYYGTLPTSESLECQAQATRYVALKRCAKKHGAAQKACKKAAATAFAKARAKIAVQKKAEKVCNETYNAALNQLSTEDPEYGTKSSQLGATYSACLAKARG
jgi:hypothetical protein